MLAHEMRKPQRPLSSEGKEFAKHRSCLAVSLNRNLTARVNLQAAKRQESNLHSPDFQVAIVSHMDRSVQSRDPTINVTSPTIWPSAHDASCVGPSW